MKRSLLMLTVLAAFLPAITGAGIPEGKSYGNGVSLSEAVAIDTLLAEPEKYLGKTVRVDGVITGVCAKRGCWMELSNAEGAGVRVKVEDGVIVIPYTAMGHKAAAEGVFEAIKLSPEQIAARKAQATEAAKTAADGGCDKEKAAVQAAEKEGGCAKDKATGEKTEEGAGCGAKVVEDTIYLIRGIGAVIQL